MILLTVQDASAYYKVGKALFSIGRKEAIEFFDLAINLNEKNPKIYY